MKKRIEGCGFTCMDYIQDGSSIICDIGGTCANVLSFLSFLGWESHIWMPLYEEKYLENCLKRRGVHIDHYAKTKKKVPMIIQTLDEASGTHRFITRCPECGSRLADINFPTRKNMQMNRNVPEVFFCDRISEGILNCATQVGELGGIAMYEPNGLRTYDQLLNACKKFQIVKFSDEKIPKKWQWDLMDDLRDGNVKLVVVTEGKAGLKFIMKRRWEWMEIRSIKYIEVRDSSGAGDWLTAVFLDYFIPRINNGKDVFDYDIIMSSLQCAMEAAELSCKEVGPHGILHNQKRVDQLERIVGASLSNEIPLYRIHESVRCPYCGKNFGM